MSGGPDASTGDRLWGVAYSEPNGFPKSHTQAMRTRRVKERCQPIGSAPLQSNQAFEALASGTGTAALATDAERLWLMNETAIAAMTAGTAIT